MGALANAAILRQDPTFRAWVETAAVYVARGVLMSDSAAPDADKPVRLALAREVAVQPQSVVPLMVTAIACDPDVATTYTTATASLEPIIIQKVQDIWTMVARLTR